MTDLNPEQLHQTPDGDVKPLPVTDALFTVPAYHRSVLNCLQTNYSDLWNWFSRHSLNADSRDEARIELLKSSYRLDRDSAAALYSLADAVAAKMGLSADYTIYQAQQSVGMNASMFTLPGEAHLVLYGPVQDALDDDELSALIAHEFAHYELNTFNDGLHDTVEQVLLALVADQAAESPHERTLRSYRLFTELHCDRRAALITGDYLACVRMLVKIETGLKNVSAESYIRQADEVLTVAAQKGCVVESEGLTHPEMFIRAKSLSLGDADPENAEDLMRPFVEGPLKLQQLDLLQQRELCDVTSKFITSYLRPKWLQTTILWGHARRFDPEIGPECCESEERLLLDIEKCDEKLRSYFCYILLDFATCDPELDEAPLAAAALFASRLGLMAEFRSVCAEELKLSKRALEKVLADAASIVDIAEKEFSA